MNESRHLYERVISNTWISHTHTHKNAHTHFSHRHTHKYTQSRSHIHRTYRHTYLCAVAAPGFHSLLGFYPPRTSGRIASAILNHHAASVPTTGKFLAR